MYLLAFAFNQACKPCFIIKHLRNMSNSLTTNVQTYTVQWNCTGLDVLNFSFWISFFLLLTWRNTSPSPTANLFHASKAVWPFSIFLSTLLFSPVFSRLFFKVYFISYKLCARFRHPRPRLSWQWQFFSGTCYMSQLLNGITESKFLLKKLSMPNVSYTLE